MSGIIPIVQIGPVTFQQICIATLTAAEAALIGQYAPDASGVQKAVGGALLSGINQTICTGIGNLASEPVDIPSGNPNVSNSISVGDVSGQAVYDAGDQTCNVSLSVPGVMDYTGQSQQNGTSISVSATFTFYTDGQVAGTFQLDSSTDANTGESQLALTVNGQQYDIPTSPEGNTLSFGDTEVSIDDTGVPTVSWPNEGGGISEFSIGLDGTVSISTPSGDATIDNDGAVSDGGVVVC